MKKDNYDSAVKVIKTAILASQYEALRSINERQLLLYFSIGKFISTNTKNGRWGENAIQIIGNKLSRELPGLKGFSQRNLYYMKEFYEEWYFLEDIQNSNFEPAGAKIQNPVLIGGFSNDYNDLLEDFLSIGFTLHRVILSKTKSLDERLFYIHQTASQKYSREQLVDALAFDEFRKIGKITNNFITTLPESIQALKAIEMFKDEYTLDFINAEELDIRDKMDIDEKVIEQGIIHNIKKFILTFGKDFAFIGNQYHLEAFGENQYIDLLFFNRELNCLVAVELKRGEFKTSYLGQLSGYLSILNKFEKKEHENPPIGIILCKNMNKSFVDMVIEDYTKPMGVSTYKDMSDRVKKSLPSIEELQKLLNKDEGEE